MNKYVSLAVQIVLHPKMKTFYWQTLNGILGVIIVILTDPNVTAEYIMVALPAIISALNIITKYINQKYL